MVFQRSNAIQPTWPVVWSRGAGNPTVYNKISEYVAATGQDRNSVSVDSGQEVLASLDAPVPSFMDSTSAVAQPLPEKVATLLSKDDDRPISRGLAQLSVVRLIQRA